MSGSDYRSEFAASLTEQAAYLSSLGHFADALEPSTEACEIYTGAGVGDAVGRAEAFTRHVIVLARLDRMGEVRFWARRALGEWHELGESGNRMLMVRILHVISVLQILAGEDGEAAGTAADALGLAPGSRMGRRGPTELRLLVRVLTARAMALAGAERPRQAAEVAGEALRKLAALADTVETATDTAETADGLDGLADPTRTHRPSPHLLLAGLDASLAEIVGMRGTRVAPEDSLLLSRHLTREGSDSAQPSLLSALGARFTQLSADGREEEAAEALREAISTARALLADGDPGYGRHVSRVMTDVGDFLWNRFVQGKLEDLDRLIDVFVSAFAGSVDTGDAKRAEAAFCLGTGLLARFEERHERRDLEDAIALLRDISERLPGSEPRQRVDWLASRALTLRYDLTGDRADLDQAVEHGLRSIDIADGEPGTGGIGGLHLDALSHLSERLWDSYHTFGTLDDLDAAISLIARSLSVLGAQHQHSARQLVSFGTALYVRFDRRGDLADLDQVIDIAREALRYDAAETDPVRIGALELLGAASRSRYERAGDGRDLDEAIAALGQLVSALPEGHEARLRPLIHLSIALRLRQPRTMDSADLVAALTAAREAAAMLPADDPRRPVTLVNLTHVLRDLFSRSGDQHLLSEAAAAAEEAVLRSPEDGPERAAVLANLAQALGARGHAQGTTADLTRAISLARHALDLVPSDSLSRSSYLDLLETLLQLGVEHEVDHGIRGQALSLAYERGSSDAGLADTLEALRRDLLAPNTLPLERVRAAERLGRLAMKAGETAVALESYRQAVELLPLALLVRRGTPTRRGGTEPGDLDELVNDAAAAAMFAGRPDQAAILLEQGRVALLAHSPGPDQLLEHLRALAPDLAAELREVSDRIADAEGTDTRQWPLSAAWEELVGRMRQLPGMASLLSPPTGSDLVAQAADGPLVMVNASRYRSDAIIVTSDGIRAVPLPGLHEELPRQLRRFRSTLAARYAPMEDHLKAEGTLGDVLHWLWSAVAEPVLDSLALQHPRPGEHRRLWWIPTGLLGLLPLHAAEEPRAGQGGRSVLDYVCPSYAATISALGAARRKPHAPLSALVVAPTGSPRVDDLPHAEREVHEVLARMGTARLLSGTEATREAVLSQLPQASVVHFACHGVMNPGSLRAGGLELADGPLTTTELRAAQPRVPQMAFLSACRTSSSGEAETPWQAVSLPATLHLGGYRHVVGTLWEVDDRTHADMASLFYAALTDRGRVSTDDASRALHEAVRRVRARYPHIPSLWAAHIHVGP